MKPSISFLHVLFCPCIVQKATSHVEKEPLNMHHQASKGFHGILVGFPQHQKWYLVYVPHRQKLLSLYEVFLNEIFYSLLVCTSQPYEEAIDMRPAVSYMPYATPSKEKLYI